MATLAFSTSILIRLITVLWNVSILPLMIVNIKIRLRRFNDPNSRVVAVSSVFLVDRINARFISHKIRGKKIDKYKRFGVESNPKLINMLLPKQCLRCFFLGNGFYFEVQFVGSDLFGINCPNSVLLSCWFQFFFGILRCLMST